MNGQGSPPLTRSNSFCAGLRAAQNVCLCALMLVWSLLISQTHSQTLQPLSTTQAELKTETSQPPVDPTNVGLQPNHNEQSPVERALQPDPNPQPPTAGASTNGLIAVPSSTSPDDSIRLRLSWGGEARQWTGRIRLTEGTFSNLQPLGLTADAAGSVIPIGDHIEIQHGSPTNYGGVDISVPCIEGAALQIELEDLNDSGIQIRETFLLSDLLHLSVTRELTANGSRFSISRVPGDKIPVRLARSHVILEPREPFEFHFHANRTEFASQTVNSRVRLQSCLTDSKGSSGGGMGAGGFNAVAGLGAGSSGTDVIKPFQFETDSNGSSLAQSIHFTAPAEEGVYLLTIELTTPWQQAAFKSRPTLTRQIQFVVLSPHAPRTDKTAAWKLLTTIDSTRESVEPQHSRVNSSLMNPVRRHQPVQTILGNPHRSPVSIGDQTMMELQPGGWQAIPIQVDQFDAPHRIEIEYLADQPAAIGISLLEANALGQIPNYGIDSGVLVPESLIAIHAASEERIKRLHRFHFWPQERLCYLLIANRSPKHPCTIGNIKLFAGPERLTDGAANGSAYEHGSSPSPAQAERRSFMAFCESGLFSKNMGARESLDEQTGQSFDDWVTFYQGANRLVQHLKVNQYTGAFIVVGGEGSSLYPSKVTGNSPRLDMGTFFSHGQDPVRKDVLELLFRMFEREGLQLVPAIVPTGPLPELEQALWEQQLREQHQGASRRTSIRPVHWNGSVSTRESASDRPIYNPLSESVQHLLTSMVDELAERYADHPSFTGLSIVARPDSYAALPGQQWGYDEETISRFWLEKTGREIESSDRNEVLRQLTGEHLEAWMNWRAQQMANGYRAMTTRLRERVPNARLFLSPVDLFRNEELNAAFTPSLHTSTDFKRQMLRVGWDAGQLAEIDGLTILKPKRIAYNHSLASNRIEIHLNNNRQMDEFFSQADSAGDLHINRISWAHFSQLQEMEPFRNQGGPLMRLQPFSPSDHWARQKFLNSLRANDCQILVEGGPHLSTSQNESLEELIRTFRQLPAVRFSEVPLNSPMNGSNQTVFPVVVRQQNAADHTWFYAVNASPWPVRLKLNSQINSTDLEWISDPPPSWKDRDGSTTTSNVTGANARTLELELEPLSLIAATVPSSRTIESYEFELPTDAANRLRKQVYVLQSKLQRATQVPAIPVLQNPDFDVDGQPTISGWQMSSGNEAAISLGQADAFNGSGYLKIRNEGAETAWIRSNAFSLTPTGRLSVSVWLRTENPAQQPPLRISIEGASDGSGYYRFGAIGALSPNPQSNQITRQWQRFAVHFDDLPIERLSSVRIGLDLMGQGEVEVDHFEIFDRWFDERDSKAITQRLASCGPLLANPMTFESCRVLLNSYWLRFLDEHFEDRSVNQMASRTADPPPTDAASDKPSDTNNEDSTTHSADGSEPNQRPLLRRLRRNGNRGSLN